MSNNSSTLTPLLRFLISIFFFVASLSAFAAFEYFKLFTPGDHYLPFGALAFAFFTLGFLSQLDLKKPSRLRSFVTSLLLSLVIATAYTAYLGLRSHRELPRLAGSGLRCESLLMPLLQYPLDRFTTLANRNLCTLGYLKENLAKLPEANAENLILKTPEFFENESVLDETTLAILLSFFHETHARTPQSREPQSDFEKLKDYFDLVEGDLSLLESYHFKNDWMNGSRLTIENLRIKKALEISTLGKTLNALFAQTEPRLDLTDQHILDPGSLPDSAGQTTLLELRVKKIKTRCRVLLMKWDLPAQLASLSLEDTYPEAYQGILKNVTVSQSFLQKIMP